MYEVAKDKIAPYPTMAELSLGASPAIEAIAPAVIIGAMAASRIDTWAAKLFQPKIVQINKATIGAMISLIVNALLNGTKSLLGSLNCNCNPTATSATGTIVEAREDKTVCTVDGNSIPIQKREMINAINGGNVITL